MILIPENRTPTHPGEILLEEFLNPMELTQRELADAILVSYQRINDIVNGRRGITPSTALRLAKFFTTSPDFWLNVQPRWEHFCNQRRKKYSIKYLQWIHIVDLNNRIFTQIN